MMRLIVGRTLIALVMIAVFLAGAIKLFDANEFYSSLRTWELIPRRLTPALAIVLPCAEVLTTGTWLAGYARRGAPLICGLLISMFTLALVAHLLFANPPRCGCFGALWVFQRHKHEAVLAVARNAVLLSLLFIGRRWVQRYDHAGKQALRARPAVSAPLAGQHAVTLPEMLVALALAGVLIFLLLPSLGGVRRAADNVRVLSDLRSHAGVMTLYSSDHADMFPYLTDPAATFSVFRHPRYGAIYVVYFGGYNTWHWPLTDAYYDEANVDSFVAPGSDRSPVSSYLYSASFLARPEFWNEFTRTGPDQWRPTRQADVLFPTKKGIVFNVNSVLPPLDEQGSPTHRPQIGFVDGSARRVPLADVTHPYPNGEGNWQGSWFRSGIRVMHTIDGVRGRDVP